MFAHEGVAVLALLFAASVAWLVVSGPAHAWALVPLGALAQMLNEYSIHRHIFHIAPPKAQWAFNLLYRVHYGHHDFPRCEKLFFVPVWFALPMAAINFGLVWGVAALLGLENAFAYAVAIVGVGGLATFLAYEWFHMTAHLPVAKTWAERRVAELHSQHHFRDFSKWFHVSPGGEVIDRAMGTAIDRDALREKGRIEFITTLGLVPDDPRLVAARARYAEPMGIGADEVARAARV